MAPCRRPGGDPAPVYGASSSYFTLEINHGGFFVGNGSDRKYLDGHIIFYDDVDTLSWSPLILEKIVEEIGYEMAERIKIFYCNPLVTMNTDLREIRDELDTRRMITLVDFGQHYFKLYLDYDQSLDAINWDDVVHFPVADLPPVISPCKPRSSTQSELPDNQDDQEPVPFQVVYPTTQNTQNSNVEDSVAGRTRESKRKRSNTTQVFETTIEEEHSQEVSDSDDEQDSDFELVDSDYVLSDGDDDLWADNVEEESDKECKSDSSSQKGKSANKKGKQKCEVKEEISDEEDLWGPDSEDETDFMRFKNFREDDLNSPKFAVGLVFANVELLRKAIRAYSCIHRKPIKLPINDKAKVRAVCEKNCSWYLWASSQLLKPCSTKQLLACLLLALLSGKVNWHINYYRCNRRKTEPMKKESWLF